MGAPNSQLTTIFSAKYQLTTIFLASSQLTTNFGQLLTFTSRQRILFLHNPNFSFLSFLQGINLHKLCHQYNLLGTENISHITKIDPDAPVMISYGSSRHGHACPAINCFKGHLFRHFHYLIGIAVLYTYLVAVCPVSCCWPTFQSIFNPCNPLQQTTRNIINAKIQS